MTTKKEIVMKQNELFNKYCENCDPKTREEVRKQMDRVLGRTALEKAAIHCQEQMAQENPGASWDCTDVQNAFKAGAEWQKQQLITFNCIGKQVAMTVQQLIDYYIDRESTDVAYECGF